MSIPQLDANTELIISRSMAAELEEYLKSDILYWPVAEPNPLGSHMPQLTIGALLEALTRAEASRADLLPPQQAELTTVRQQLDRIRAAHSALFIGKASHELLSRVKSFQTNVADVHWRTRAFYAQDARVRAKIYLLEQALGSATPPDIQQRREQLDRALFEIFVPGDFIWDARLLQAFPQNPCWWLYGRLLEESRR